MNSKDLRIGNLVNAYLGAPISESVESIVTLDVLKYIQDGNDSKKTTYEPIPLTEEWLKRFGFEYLIKSDMYSIELESEGVLVLSLVDYSYGLGDYLDAYLEGDHYCRGKNLKHTHQLQNLYHALTGEELELKPLQP